MRNRTVSLLAAFGVACALFSSKALAADPVVNGKVKVEVYRGIGGTAVGNLTGNAAYPNSPSSIHYVDSLEYPDAATYPDPGDATKPRGDVFNDYGIRISGFIVPKETAEYIFYLAADDNAQFYLSTDENPANAKEIAMEPQWNPVRAFTATDRRVCADPDPTGFVKCDNVSNPVRLEANKRYYFYGLMKEGGGGDNYAVTWSKKGEAPAETPIAAEFLATSAPSAPAITGQPKDAAVIAGSPVTFSVGLNIPPTVTVSSIKWQKNGTDIPNSNSADLTVTPTVADDGAKYKAVVTTSGGNLTSSEATLTVATLTSEFAAGVVKFEAYHDITGTAVDGLLTSDKYIAGTPDAVRLLGAIDTPNGYGENYGAKVSGFIVPKESGSYRFFIRSDDASQFYLSTDDKEANATMIAEETGCCGAFMDVDNPETSEPQALVAGRRYAFYALVKEGGGGDFLQVAWRKEGDTTPAGSLTPLAGSVIGANAKISKGDLAITQQPAAVTADEGRNVTLTVDATTSPAAFNLPLLVQWQKNGTDIPGATSKTLTIANAKVSDSGTYRAVLNVAGVKSVNSADAAVTITTDTAGPVIAGAGAVKKGANTEIGIAFDEAVEVASASAQANYTISKGTIQSVRFVSQSPGVVLVVSGVNAGDKVTVTANNVKDAKGNNRATTSKEVTVPAKLLNWTGVGGNDLNGALTRTDFNDDVVARGEKDFDLISGGSQHWTNYDEETFVYEEITGDFDKVVRVEYQDPVTQWSRAGLDARESLDEGKTRADIDGGYKFSQHFTVRVNPPAVLGWDGRTGNNTYEVVHRPVEGANYDGFNAMFNILNGAGPAPGYPNAWIRLKREGQKLTAFMSNDGKTWTAIGNVTYQNDPASEENETLADKLFVGMFYAPEFYNIAEDARPQRASSIAKFRDYGDFSTGGSGPGTGAIQSVSLSGGNIVITFTGSLEQSDSVSGPWTAVTGASPHSAAATGKSKFYRIKP